MVNTLAQETLQNAGVDGFQGSGTHVLQPEQREMPSKSSAQHTATASRRATGPYEDEVQNLDVFHLFQVIKSSLVYDLAQKLNRWLSAEDFWLGCIKIVDKDDHGFVESSAQFVFLALHKLFPVKEKIQHLLIVGKGGEVHIRLGVMLF